MEMVPAPVLATPQLSSTKTTPPRQPDAMEPERQASTDFEEYRRKEKENHTLLHDPLNREPEEPRETTEATSTATNGSAEATRATAPRPRYDLRSTAQRFYLTHLKEIEPKPILRRHDSAPPTYRNVTIDETQNRATPYEVVVGNHSVQLEQ